MELNKEAVATIARSESQHMRTNSGDAVFLFSYEGLMRFAEGLGEYIIGVNPSIQGLGLPGGPLHSGGPASSGITVVAPANWFDKKNQDMIAGFGVPVLNKHSELAPVNPVPRFGPLTIDQQFAELAISHNKLQKELENYKADCERLKSELAKENTWAIQFKEESKKTYDELQQVKGLSETYKTAYEVSQEELRKEASMSFDLRRKLERYEKLINSVKVFEL